MKKAVLGLGGNLGNRKENLSAALDALGRLPKTKVSRVSRCYETAPFQVFDAQPDYLNCCAEIETDLSPRALLGACLGIEAAMGRVRLVEKGARVLDIDLLLYEGEASGDGELTLPHPRMLERGFVLVPLSDLYPEGTALGLDFSRALTLVERDGVRLCPEAEEPEKTERSSGGEG